MNHLRATDPEFMERFEHFAFDEAVHEPGQELDDVTRSIAILAALLGCQGIDAFERLALPQALDAGVSPVAVKEIVYQGVDYLGIGRVLPFLEAVNRVLTARGVALPLAGQATTTRCWRPGNPAISTAGWPPTASATTIPAPVWT